MSKLLSKKLLMLMLAIPLLFASCKKDDDDPIELLPKLEGVYIYGTSTVAASATDPNARMALAQLVPDQGAKVENMPGVYGKLMHIGANSSIKIVQIVAEVPTRFGLVDGGSKKLGTDVGSVNDQVIAGTLVKDGADIKITEEGLYYVYLDINTLNFIAMPVKPNMIGDATPGQWATGTSLALVSSTKDSTVFESTMELAGAAGYRYRLNDGWNQFADGNIVVFGSLGVVDYGVAWDTGVNDLGFFLSNIPNKIGGATKVRLTYTAKTTTWKELKISSLDNVQLNLFGNAFLIDGVQAAWDKPYGLSKPVASGTKYTWTWDNVDLIEGQQFVVNQDGGWAGIIVAYTGNTLTGNAFTDGKIVNAIDEGNPDANFFVKTGGKYKIELTIDGVGGARTLNITAK